jgi:hypothetical protein
MPTPAQHVMTYDTLRAAVCNGDTVAVHARGVYGAALALGAMGPHGHVGIVRRVVIDGTERVFVIEENPGGGRYTPLSHYQHSQLDIYSAPAGTDGHAASAHAVHMLDGLAEYDFADIARLAKWGAVRALARWFDDHLPMPPETDVTEGSQGVICSALVTAAYKRAGWVPAGPCGWPSALTLQLGAPRITYHPQAQA